MAYIEKKIQEKQYSFVKLLADDQPGRSAHRCDAYWSLWMAAN
jgi:hypothetical protein